MMIYKKSLFCLFFLSGSILWAQEERFANAPPFSFIHSYQQATGTNAALFNGKASTPYPRTFINHPYFETNSYVKGTLCYNSVVYKDILMLIDLFRDEITVISPDSPYRIVLENEKIDYAILHGCTFVTSVDKKGVKDKLLVMLHNGTYPVTKKYRLAINEEKSSNVLSLTRSFKTNIQYAVYVDGAFYPVKSKNSMLKLFPERKQELNDYAKMHQLDFKKQIEQSIIALVSHYEYLTERTEAGLSPTNQQPIKSVDDKIQPFHTEDLIAANEMNDFDKSDRITQDKVTLNYVQQPANMIFNSIAQQSGYAVYYNSLETDSLLLTIQCEGLTPEAALNKAFEGTPFQVSVFQDKYIFILKGKQLHTILPEDFFAVRKRQRGLTTGLSISPVEQKATSENKVYTIGDENAQNIPERVRLSGTMTDFRTGEPVIGAAIYVENNTRTGVTTDASGFYSMQLPSGRSKLLIRGVGIKETQRNVMLFSDGKLDIELEEQLYSLQEIVVTAERTTGIQSTVIGVERLQMKEIKNIPTAFGETDVIRVVMMLPGVKSVGEVGSGFNVRGGSTDQNLILFNNGTIYNPTHLFGFFSVFNPDLIKDMELYKSSIPAKFGGRISSVLDINGREGNKKEFTGSVSLGLLTSRITLEGPIGKKTSFILGGRTTYSNWMLDLLPDDSEYKHGKAGFYDLNLIIDHKFSDKDNLYLSSYYSNDRFQFTPEDLYGYNNMNASAKWRHLFSNRFTGTFVAGYDHYDYNMSMRENPINAYSLQFGIDQQFARFDFTAYAHDKHTIDFGLGSIFYNLTPGKYLPDSPESLVKPDLIQKEKALESHIYLSDIWDISPALSINAGVRFSMFNAIGPRTYNLYDPTYLPQETSILGIKEAKSGSIFQTYQNPELRLSARYIVNKDLSFKAGVNTLSQYIHKLSNTTIMSPTDTWKLSDAHIKPQKGMQAAAGIYKNFRSGIIETSVEVYYKTMKDYLDYRSGALLSMNHHIETDVINTQGRAYGFELMIKKTQGKLNGWISYSYSKTELRQHDPRATKPVNKGNWYPASFDKPHDFKLAGNYKFTQRYSVSMNCEYSTGRPITLPSSKYEYAGGEYIFYSERNQYRIPDFFRMDFAINIEPSHHLTLLTHSSISVGVYNLTGRKNTYSAYYTAKNGVISGYQMAVFGAPIPYVSYNIKF